MMEEQRAIRVEVVVPMPKDPTPEQLEAVQVVLNVDAFNAVLRQLWIQPQSEPEPE